ncbi:MAG TPA: hypothetical protein VFR01_03945, partial [Geobacterales bacterium]|nr:hypothetical protein [Geobacterales bacterium]
MPRKIVLQLLLCSLLLLLAPAASYANAYGQLESIAGPAPEPPPVPEPSCAECGGRNGNHSRNCPYYGGGSSDGDSGSTTPVDVTRAPIFVAPVGMIGGVFMGAGWYFEEMAGHFPKKGFLSSYSEYVSIKDEDDVRRKSFNFGSHIGALPWLALFAP